MLVDELHDVALSFQITPLSARHMSDMPTPDGLAGFIARLLQPQLDDKRLQLRLWFVHSLRQKDKSDLGVARVPQLNECPLHPLYTDAASQQRLPSVYGFVLFEDREKFCFGSGNWQWEASSRNELSQTGV
jgi:hypothetical protein